MAKQKLTDRQSLSTSSDSSLIHVVEGGSSYKQTKDDFLKEDRERLDALEVSDASQGTDIDSLESRVDNLEENQYSGVVVYETLASLPATGTVNTSYKVSNDSTSSNNGYYHWNGSAYVKDASLANGVIEEGNVDAVSGGTVYDKFLNLGKNKLVLADFLEGYYYNTNTGVLTPSASFYTTGKQSVLPNTTYTFSDGNIGIYYRIHFFDVAGNWLGTNLTPEYTSNVLIEGSGGQYGATFYFTTPSDCYYTAFIAGASYYINFAEFQNTCQLERGLTVTEYVSPNAVSIKEDLFVYETLKLNLGIDQEFKALNVTVFGDSISIITNNWTTKFKEITGIINLTNRAVSGQRITWTAGTVVPATPTGTDNNVLWNSILSYQTTFPSAEPDVIIIAEGTNDVGQLMDLGSYTSAFAQSEDVTTQLTMANAYRKAIFKLITDYPNAQIFCMTPLQSELGNRTFDLMQSARNILVDVSKRMNVKVIDCFNLSGIIQEFETALSLKYTYDRLHPNLEGSVIHGKCVAKEFEKLYYLES